MGNNRVLRVGAAGLLVCVTHNAHALDASQAQSGGMGKTVRSSVHEAASVYAAPGLVWVGERFDMGAGGGLDTDGSRSFFVGAHDGQTSAIGLGVHWISRRAEAVPSPDELPGWRRKGETFNNEVESSVIAAAIGGGGVHHLFGFGVGLRYYSRTSTLRGASRSFNVAPSVAGVVADQVTLSLTVENPLPFEYIDAPLGVGTGARWQPTPRFAVALDTLTDLGSVPGEVRFSPMVGAEMWLHEMVPTRVGWTQDGITQRQQVTLGLGVASDAMDFSYACGGLWSSDSGPTLHQLAIRLSM